VSACRHRLKATRAHKAPRRNGKISTYIVTAVGDGFDGDRATEDVVCSRAEVPEEGILNRALVRQAALKPS